MINFNIRFLSITLLSLTAALLLTACPDNSPPECGDHQIEVNGTCECEEGYHWNEDQTRCLMDTTSHNFSWTIDTLGNYNSYLYDVDFIDENNVWVAGIFETDSGEYNVAHWNGNKWKFILIDRVIGFDGISIISENDIWFTDGCYIYHYNGEQFNRVWECDWQTYGTGQVKRIIYTQQGNIYTIGNNGSVCKYTGSDFERMRTNTAVDLTDIACDENDNIFVAGWSESGEESGNSVFMEMTDGQWNIVREEDHFFPNNSNEWGLISSVWVNNDTCYVMTYGGLQRFSIETNTTSRWFSPSEMKASERHVVRFMGPATNNILFSDSWGYFIHYNGENWKRISDIYDMGNHGDIIINSMKYKDNFVVACGIHLPSRKAIVIFGKHI